VGSLCRRVRRPRPCIAGGRRCRLGQLEHSARLKCRRGPTRAEACRAGTGLSRAGGGGRGRSRRREGSTAGGEDGEGPWNLSGWERGVETGEEGGESQRVARGATGIVISAWMTCVSGWARGEGNVGGRPLKIRRSGSRRLVVTLGFE